MSIKLKDFKRIAIGFVLIELTKKNTPAYRPDQSGLHLKEGTVLKVGLPVTDEEIDAWHTRLLVGRETPIQVKEGDTVRVPQSGLKDVEHTADGEQFCIVYHQDILTWTPKED